jgi:sterol desaturase/sphingolipid hydroxylase (fatty acid hydroxylase superfamily)
MLEPWVRPTAFLATFILMFALESLLPRKQRTESRFQRTWNNLALSVVNSVLVRFVPLLSAVGAAAYAQTHGIGLFNLLELPVVLEYAAVLVLFDLIIYWQHVASHQLPMLWRFHQVHHADHDLDASSGLRFHPVEIAFSMVIKCLTVLLLGATPESVVLFEIVLNSCAVFSHSNFKLPLGLDRVMRLFVVTPDMHRVHHSIHRDETNSNYGFNIPWWDRLFRTYRDQPRDQHEAMQLGLPEFPRSKQTVWLGAMLKLPFIKQPDKSTVDSKLSKMQQSVAGSKP